MKTQIILWTFIAGIVFFGNLEATSATIRVVAYNTCNNPDDPIEDAWFHTIFSAIGNESVNGIAERLDILAVSETDSDSSDHLADILNNLYDVTTYNAITSSSVGGDRTGVIYDSNSLTLIDSNDITDIGNHPILRAHFRPVGYTSINSEFYVYAVHLKSGSSTSIKAQRALEAANLRSNADALGEGKNIIFAGDFNMLGSSEAAWVNMLAPGNGQAFDIANSPGEWRGDEDFKSFHSQDSRGPMDDRFDIQFASGEFLDGTGFEYIFDSFHVYGNNGTHVLNDSISTGSGATAAVLTALENASDHLPIVADYQIPESLCDSFSIVDDHERDLPGTPPTGWYYHRAGGDRGLLNDASADPPGSVDYSISSESSYQAVISNIPEDALWTYMGMWYMISHARNQKLNLDASNIYSSVIKDQYQPQITGIRLLVNDVQSPDGLPSLHFKVELKEIESNGNEILRISKMWNRSELLASSYPRYFELHFAPEQLEGEVGLILWVMDYCKIGDMIDIDKIEICVDMPQMNSASEEAALISLGMLLDNYDSNTGMVGDRSWFPVEDLENVTATAKLAKILAMAVEAGIVDEEKAIEEINKITTVFLTVVPQGPSEQNYLLPHFTQNGGTQIVLNTEWASGDTAYALLDLLIALKMINDPQTKIGEVLDLIKKIDWAAIQKVDGTFSHGYDYEGNLIPSSWFGFGTETIGVLLAAKIGDNIVEQMDTAPSDNGSGFILHAAYPILFTAMDIFGNDWLALREQEILDQMNWYSNPEHTNDFFIAEGFYGLSAAEIPEGWDPDPNLIYKAFGIGGKYMPALYKDNHDRDVVTGHYHGMTSILQKNASENMFNGLKDMGFMGSFTNMESMSVDVSGKYTVNFLRGSWNLALQAEGWLWSFPQVESAVYNAFRNISELMDAYNAYFIPECGDPLHPYPIGDLSEDCQVNLIDFRVMALQWLQAPGVPSADISPHPDGDGIVNLLDLAVMTENWLFDD